MAACTTDADCGAPADWCTVATVCDARLLACGRVPRCAVPPWLTCVPSAERCVDAADSVGMPTSSPAPAPWFVAVLVLGLVASLILGVLLVYLYMRTRRDPPSRAWSPAPMPMDRPLVRVNTLPPQQPLLGVSAYA